MYYCQSSILLFSGCAIPAGVGLVMRKMGNAATPTVEITEEDGTYTLKTVTTFKTTEIKFKVGEEFEETTADGRNVKVNLRQFILLCFNIFFYCADSLQ